MDRLLIYSEPSIMALSQTFQLTHDSSQLARLAVSTVDSIAIGMWLLNFIFLVMVHSLAMSKMDGWLDQSRAILRFAAYFIL